MGRRRGRWVVGRGVSFIYVDQMEKSVLSFMVLFSVENCFIGIRSRKEAHFDTCESISKPH